MSEAELYQGDECTLDYTADAAITGGEVVQLRDGRAAVIPVDCANGEKVGAQAEGIYNVVKTANQVWIDGAEIYWDHSANAATCVPPLVAGDRDFFLGTAVGDVAAAATEGKVNLNVRPAYEIDMQSSGGDTAVVLTAGTPTIVSRGGTLHAAFSATNEAQKLDWLSKRSFALGSNWILEGVFEVVTNADADVADLSIGVANATNASDADSITESAFIHLDMGGSLNIFAESDDGTNEVAATDTTLDFAVGTPVFVCIDGRNPASLKFYVNGVQVLSSTTFNISAATGPLKALFHLEKTANDSPGIVDCDMLRVRTGQQ
jgi:predicted RecA/RadA family phage recombinase